MEVSRLEAMHGESELEIARHNRRLSWDEIVQRLTVAAEEVEQAWGDCDDLGVYAPTLLSRALADEAKELRRLLAQATDARDSCR
jgi:hypothetical protein